MTDDLEVFDGSLSIRDPKGGFHVVQTPVGFTDLSFRNTVAAIYTYFMHEGRLPTVDELHEAWPKIPKTTYAKLFVTEELRTALEYRGIQWSSDSGLSIEQQMAIVKLSDPTDRRSLAVKLRELGIPMPRYQAWLRQPLFMQAYGKQTTGNYTDFLPEIRQQLIGNALSGNMDATKLIYAITGEWDPADRAVQDAKEVVYSVIEAVIANVKDVEIRRAIMADIQARVLAFDVTHLRQLEG